MTPYEQLRARWDATTWVKPSFLWMMERCGWATKVDQQRVLAVRLKRRAFDGAVEQAVPTSRTAVASIRVQWDPERNLRGGKLPYRSLQLGLGREVIRAYATEWLVGIDDVTPLVKRIDALRRQGAWEAAARLLPEERPYLVRST